MSHAPTEEYARQLDAADELARFRDRFSIPDGKNGESAVYFCGNSLGLQPRGARARIVQEMDDWARLAVDAHFDGTNPWYPYHEQFRESAGRIVGGNPGEVVMMNGLTVNLHLMLVSFYRPTTERHKVLMEQPSFPSDSYAVQTQLRYHGHDPDAGILRAAPRSGESCLRTDDILEL
jgi:kynureninase